MSVKSLLLVWRDKKSRLYFHVGTLTYNGDLYKFEYTHQSKAYRKVKAALNVGYTLHPAFPQLTKIYESEKLFPAFARRIPSKSRVDYGEVLKKLSLPKEADQMDILRATRGMTGKNPYFFDEPLRLIDNNILKNNFYISGMRYREFPDPWSTLLREGDELILEPDFENEVDPNAVKIFTKDKLFLGFVPGIFSKAIGALLKRNTEMKITITQINPTYTPQLWVKVNFQSVLEKNLSNTELIELDSLLILAA